MGLAMLAAGALYADYAGGAFLAMAGLSAAGAVVAGVLWRLTQKKRQPPEKVSSS